MAVLFGKHSRPERLRRVLCSPSMVESARGRPILLDGGRARHQLRHCAIAAGVINDKSSGFKRQNNMLLFGVRCCPTSIFSCTDRTGAEFEAAPDLLQLLFKKICQT